MPVNPANPKPRRETDRHVLAFETWYSLAGKDIAKTSNHLRKGGQKISVDTLYRWLKHYNWEARAKERDEVVQKQRFEVAIREKEGMLGRHLGIARLLQKQAIDYLQPAPPPLPGTPLDKIPNPTRVANVPQAIAAIRLGVDMERLSAGLPSWLVDIMNASDDDLQTLFESALTSIGVDTKGDATAGASEKNFPDVEIEPISKPD